MSKEGYYIEEGKRYIPEVLWERWESLLNQA